MRAFHQSLLMDSQRSDLQRRAEASGQEMAEHIRLRREFARRNEDLEADNLSQSTKTSKAEAEHMKE